MIAAGAISGSSALPRFETDSFNRAGDCEGKVSSAEQAQPLSEVSLNQRASTIFLRSESRQSYTYTHLQSYSSTFQPAAAEPIEKIAPPADGAILASGNILKFIEAQLIRDKQDGASTEAMASRLQAGLDGFEQGFGEALDMLKGLGGMSDGILAELQQTHDLVTAGIEEFRLRYVEGKEPAPAAEVETVTSPEPPERNLQPPLATAMSAYSRNDVAEKNSFSFTLTTADGDTVLIKTRSIRASVVESYLAQKEGVDARIQESQSQREQFSFEVGGELDAGELSAINDLLHQVSALSEEFFSGNLDQAFKMASELGYDATEISAFALNLTHTSVRRVTEAYSDGQTIRQPSSLVEQLQPLGEYINKVLEAYGTASQFKTPTELMQTLAEWFDDSNRLLFVEAIQKALAGQS